MEAGEARQLELIAGAARRALAASRVAPWDADDVCQDVLESAWRNRTLQELGPSREAAAYAATAARNRLRNAWRRRAREAACVPTLETVHALYTSSESIELRPLVLKVLEVLLEMPHELFLPLFHCGVAAESSATAARALGLPVGTLKTRLRKARAYVHARLEDAPGTEWGRRRRRTRRFRRKPLRHDAQRR